MPDHLTLRLLDGDRAGEAIALPEGIFRVGRKAGNDLVLADPSVSGQHAELRVDDLGATLIDLGSTNGTRVDGVTVREVRLVGGVRLRFGNVEALLEDGAQGEDSRAALAGEALSGGDSRQTAQRLARARGGGRLRVALVLVLAGAAAGAWHFLPSEGQGGEPAHLAPPSPARPGDLLAASHSFERGLDAWSAPEGQASQFEALRTAARTGALGILGEAPAGLSSWASPLRPVTSKGLRLLCALRVPSGRARVAVEFHGPEAARPLRVNLGWCAGSDWQEIDQPISVPAGSKQVRAVLEVEGLTDDGGLAHFDDLSLLPESRARVLGEVGVRAFVGSGEPLRQLGLETVGQGVLQSLVRTDEDSFRVEAIPGGLRVAADGPTDWLISAADGIAAQGLRSLSAGGSLGHPTSFEREQASMLLLGSGNQQVALSPAEPTLLAGFPHEDGTWSFRLRARSIDLTVEFEQHLTAVLERRSLARKAEAAGRPGEALRLWQALLAEVPYDPESNAEAEAALARLDRLAHSELAALEEALARARFFRLVEGFESALARADTLAATYVGTDVEAALQAAAEPARAELLLLRRDLQALESSRLAAIHAALSASGGGPLTEAVAEALQRGRGGRN